MKISIICAMDEKRGIGKDNRIPWYIKDDLVKLKSLTKDHVVILGRKTYESMVFYYNRTGNPMPGKLYVVITHDKNYKPSRENAVIAHSLKEAVQQNIARHSGDPAKPKTPESPPLKVVRDSGQDGYQTVTRQAKMTISNGDEVFVIGGGQIFQQVLPFADKLYLTIVQGDYNCDTFFPDYSGFRKVVCEESKESENHKYKFLELERG